MTCAHAAMLVAVCALMTVSVGGCRPGEQDRPLQHKPGIYLGQPDEKLSDNQVRELQQRGNLLR